MNDLQLGGTTKRWSRQALLLGCVTAVCSITLVLSACVGSDELAEADSPIFAGLPADVVTEVLASKAVQARTGFLDGAGKDTMLQGITLNFMLCRQAYSAYERWIITGQVDTLPPAARPTNPDEIAYGDYLAGRRQFESALQGGDIDVLRSMLVNESGCGSWIPATPNDESGPTIADAVRQ